MDFVLVGAAEGRDLRHPQGRRHAMPGKPKVLVVDDERNLRTLYQRELEREGYQVVSAASAREGLALIESERPDVVVLDIRMPGMDGLEALARTLDQHPQLPVILNTAYSCYQDDFLSWAADAYLVKSADVSELLEKIRSLVPASGPAT
jgi:two-component system response regulator (stage 0 sporulation protein F)